MFEKGQILRKIWICLNNCFWSNQLKGTNINKNGFSPQNKPHTAKLCFSVVLKYFRANSLKTSLFSQKLTISERNTEIIRKFVFHNKFEKGQTKRKIWICLNNCFWTNQWKGTNINKNCFSHQNEPHTAKLYFPVVLKHFSGNFTENFSF